MSKMMSAAAAKAQFADCLREAEGGEPVVITRYGKPVAALVSADDLVVLERVRAASPVDGLAGLVGLYDDGDEFADAVDQVVELRGLGRPLDSLE